MKKLIITVVVAALGLSACATGAARTLEPVANDPSPAVESPTPKPAKDKPKSNKPPKGQETPKQQGTGSPSNAEPRSCSTVRGGSEGSVAQLVDVRVGAHAHYDRVTFEFAPPSDGRHFGLPPFEIRSATPPITQDGSGKQVNVEGERFAVVVFHGASGVEFTDDGYTVTYDGPKEFTPGYEALAEAEQTGDFEATLSWAFGLDEGSCWSVLDLDDPLRLAIDFSH